MAMVSQLKPIADSGDQIRSRTLGGEAKGGYLQGLEKGTKDTNPGDCGESWETRRLWGRSLYVTKLVTPGVDVHGPRRVWCGESPI